MSVKKILKELLEDNPDYSGRWDMDFKMDLQTKNHIRLVRLCQLLGFEDLYDDKKRQEYVQKMKSKMLKQFSKEANGYFDNEDEDDDSVEVGGWCVESKEVTFILNPSQISVLSYPLQLLEKIDEPICTDRMPMLNSGFNGEREVKL